MSLAWIWQSARAISRSCQINISKTIFSWKQFLIQLPTIFLEHQQNKIYRSEVIEEKAPLWPRKEALKNFVKVQRMHLSKESQGTDMARGTWAGDTSFLSFFSDDYEKRSIATSILIMKLKLTTMFLYPLYFLLSC